MRLYKILFPVIYYTVTASYDYGGVYNYTHNHSYTKPSYYYKYEMSWDEKALNFAESFVENFLYELWNTIHYERGNFTVTCLEPLICVKYNYEQDYPNYNYRVEIDYDFTGKQKAKNSYAINWTEGPVHGMTTFKLDLNHSGDYTQLGLGKSPVSIENFEENISHLVTIGSNSMDINSKGNYKYYMSGKNESLKTSYHIFSNDFKETQKKGPNGYDIPSTGKMTIQMNANWDITDGFRTMLGLPKMDFSVKISNKFYLNLEKMKYYLRIKGTAFAQKLPKIIFGISVNEKNQSVILQTMIDKSSGTIIAKIFADGWGRAYGWMQNGPLSFTKSKPLHILTYPITDEAYDSMDKEIEKDSQFLKPGKFGKNPNQINRKINLAVYVYGEMHNVWYYYSILGKRWYKSLLDGVKVIAFADRWSADIEKEHALDWSPVIKASKVDSGLVGLLLLVTDGTKEGEFNKYVADQVSVYSKVVEKELAKELAFMGDFRHMVLDLVGKKGEEKFDALFDVKPPINY